MLHLMAPWPMKVASPLVCFPRWRSGLQFWGHGSMNACQTVLRGAEKRGTGSLGIFISLLSLGHRLVLILVHFSGLEHWSKRQCPKTVPQVAMYSVTCRPVPFSSSVLSTASWCSHWISMISSNLCVCVTAIYSPPSSPHKTKCLYAVRQYVLPNTKGIVQCSPLASLNSCTLMTWMHLCGVGMSKN